LYTIQSLRFFIANYSTFVFLSPIIPKNKNVLISIQNVFNLYQL